MSLDSIEFLQAIVDDGIPKVKEYLIIEALRYLRQDLHFFNVYWVNNISKTPHTAVSVIDNNSDKVLFQIPPLVILKNNYNNKLGSELTKVRSELESTPALRNMLLANSLYANISVVADTTEVRDGWKDLFLRYGYEDLLDKDDETLAHENNTFNNALSFFDD